jgi:hypothetical protein
MVQTTRREWAAALAATAAPVLAQAPPAERPAAPGDASAQARADLLRATGQVRSFALPEAAEPAFVFKP